VAGAEAAKDEEGTRTSRSGTTDQANATGFAMLNFAWRNNALQPEAEAAGVHVEPPRLQGDYYGQGGETALSFESHWRLSAGGDVLVQMGGRSEQFTHDPGATTTVSIDVTVDGASNVSRLPDVPVRCGVGFADLDGETARVNLGLPHATAGGGVHLATRNGTTLVLADSLVLRPETASGSVTFPGKQDERFDGTTMSFAMSSAATGDAGFAFDYWSGPLISSPYWFIGDVHWPKFGAQAP
jgi:hypothetical protein